MHLVFQETYNMHISDIKVYGVNMGPTSVLSSPGGPHVGPMHIAIRDLVLYC